MKVKNIDLGMFGTLAVFIGKDIEKMVEEGSLLKSSVDEEMIAEIVGK